MLYDTWILSDKIIVHKAYMANDLRVSRTIVDKYKQINKTKKHMNASMGTCNISKRKMSYGLECLLDLRSHMIIKNL